MPFRIVHLSSLRNPLLQDVRRAAAKGMPTEEGLLIVEGPHLVDELARSAWKIEKLLLVPEILPDWENRARQLDVEVLLIPHRAFTSMASTETSQGVIALARSRSYSWDDLQRLPTLLIVLDGIQDPGNAGAIIRSAEAFGATGAILLDHSARLSNPKLIRASAGSLFRIPILHAVSADEFRSKAREYGWQLFALHASGASELSSSQFGQSCALIVGSEGRGVSPELLAISISVTIPTSRVESLNAAVAASIALYEASFQRRTDEPVRYR
jgi:TrmH family RNA methyltransferase